jgi:hypothetical protein
MVPIQWSSIICVIDASKKTWLLCESHTLQFFYRLVGMSMNRSQQGCENRTGPAGSTGWTCKTRCNISTPKIIRLILN